MTDTVEQESTVIDETFESPFIENQLEKVGNETPSQRQRRKKSSPLSNSVILPERSVRTRKPPSRYSLSVTPRAGRIAKTPRLEYKARVTVQRNRKSLDEPNPDRIDPNNPLRLYKKNTGFAYDYDPDVSNIQILNSYSLANTDQEAAGPSSSKYPGGSATSAQSDNARTMPSCGTGTLILKTVSGLVLEGVQFPWNKWSS